MKLSREQFVKAVETLEGMIEKEKETFEVLEVDSLWVFSKWINNYFDLLTEVCELNGYSSYWNILDWFCFETDFGRKTKRRFATDPSGREWEIKNADDLYSLIIRGKGLEGND